jgi:integrase/recombinase XerD
VIEADRALVDRFLDMLAAETGASANTMAAYRNDLEKASHDLGTTLGTASRDALATLGQKWAGLAASTVARRSSALRRFYRFLVDDGLRTDDPSAALPKPKLQRPLPKVLSEADVEAMFEAAGDKAASGEPLAQRNMELL